MAAGALMGDGEDPSASEGQLHLALVSPTRGAVGGADRDWINLANALGPERLRLSWIGITGTAVVRPHIDPRVLVRVEDSGGPLFTYLCHGGLTSRSVSLWAKILLDQSLRSIAPLWRVRRALRQDPPDIVVSASSTVLLGPLLAMGHRVPHIWSVKEYLNPESTACRKFARWITRISRRVVVPSRAMTGAFERPPDVLPDGVDLRLLDDAARRSSRAGTLRELGLPVDLPLVAQVGHLHPRKGQHVLAEAFRTLADEGQLPHSLVFLGSGGQDYVRQVAAILDRADSVWRDRVRIREFAPGEYEYLAAADLVVHPSTEPDPLPNAVREAMALGKPVIASATGGIPEMVENSVDGLLVTPGAVLELAQAIRGLLESADRRSRLGQAARATAKERFDIRVRSRPFAQLLAREAANRR
jgi:glycosyltransferase involved in cell wall biosynthesis